MTVVTRFAPSPTGFLHIGSARTALFNWLYAKANGGKFLLRVEDTDKERSTEEAKAAILSGLGWLGIDWDDEVVYQSERQERHCAIVQRLLDEGKAYYCYCTPEELDAMRQKAKDEKRSFRYEGIWRDKDPKDAPEGVDPVVRLRAPEGGSVTIADAIQGDVTVSHDQLDDMVLLRSDGSPTYMLAVVVDDHDMGVTQVIRGDDHFTNSFRQALLYEALEWKQPLFAHIPLIHGPDGAKLSKRHGALGVEAYRDKGYLPEAVCNYLLRLGWSHGDDEIITRAQSIEWFDLEHIGKSPARFDLQKLAHLNAHYMKESDASDLIQLLERDFYKQSFNEESIRRLTSGMNGLVQRSKTLEELYALSAIYTESPSSFTEKAQKAIDDGRQWLGEVVPILDALDNWCIDTLEVALKSYAQEKDVKLGKLMGAVRGAVTGRDVAPSMFEVMCILRKDSVVGRIKACL